MCSSFRRWGTESQLPLPSTDTFEASFAPDVIVCSFLHYCCCRPLLSLLLLSSSVASSIVVVAIERYRSSLCLQFKPRHIAAGAVLLAAKCLNYELALYPSFWHEFQTTPAILQDIVQQLMELL
ncbi:hypothetical protein MUK42_18754 [Musa troglodytarum]|uniref:Cyclin N-terminal domain-containing protein n=1 Tax=Musa troglodytarum TaxID=320322 RepID=A0A9E7HAW6_9LILI|nr:hypothetical protein MUK42_18754 [Musa troglodytarum]